MSMALTKVPGRDTKIQNFPVGRISRAKTFRTECVNCFCDIYKPKMQKNSGCAKTFWSVMPTRQRGFCDSGAWHNRAALSVAKSQPIWQYKAGCGNSPAHPTWSLLPFIKGRCPNILVSKFYCTYKGNSTLVILIWHWTIGQSNHQDPPTHCKHFKWVQFHKYKGSVDAGSTTDIRMLWSAIVCLGLGLL